MRGLLLLSFLAMGVSGGSLLAGAALTADEIVDRWVARTRTTAERQQGQVYQCLRTTVIEELGSDGDVRKRNTKEHRVTSTNGVERAAILRLDGKEPPARDARAEEARERGNREKYTRRKDARQRGDPDMIDEKLIRRFEYRLIGTDLIEGRTNHVLQFSAKPAADGETADRFIGALNGQVWLDAEEFELSRIDAKLRSPVEILGGIAGAVKRLEMRVERKRLAQGFWTSAALGSFLEVRKFLSTSRLRMEVANDQFEVVAPKH
jgi:hypothetical protein